MDERDALQRARDELAEGRPWLARDRAAGLLAHRHGDPAVLEVLGDAWMALGDEVRAGRYLFLTSRDDASSSKATAAFMSSHAVAAEAAVAVRVIDGIDYPPAARFRIAELRARVEAGGGEWRPGRPPHRRPPPLPKSFLRRALGTLAVGLAVVAIPGLWLFGLVSLMTLLLR